MVGLLVAGGCADNVENPVAGPSTTVGVSTTAASPTTTTVASTPTTPTALPPGQPPTDPSDPTAQQAAQRLVDAWLAGDSAAAVAIAGSDVANVLFAVPPPPAADPQPCRGSETEVGAVECDYLYEGGTLTLVITGNAGSGYRVTNAGVVPV